jgi:hypothetical protein
LDSSARAAFAGAAPACRRGFAVTVHHAERVGGLGWRQRRRARAHRRRRGRSGATWHRGACRRLALARAGARYSASVRSKAFRVCSGLGRTSAQGSTNAPARSRTQGRRSSVLRVRSVPCGSGGSLSDSVVPAEPLEGPGEVPDGPPVEGLGSARKPRSPQASSTAFDYESVLNNDMPVGKLWSAGTPEHQRSLDFDSRLSNPQQPHAAPGRRTGRHLGCIAGCFRRWPSV